MLVGAGRAPSVVERAAWAVSSSSRRFFVVLAVVVPLTIVVTSAAAAGVAARSAAATADARDRGLRVAGSVTEFRNHLSLADAEVATTLVSGEEFSPLGHARYEAELLAAGLSLTDAGLVATGRSADDITALAEGLARYAGLVETAHPYPVGSTFDAMARAQVRDTLVPTAERVRLAAEDEVEGAADRVAGPWTTVAIGGLVLALVLLVGSVVLVAGRTRIRLHPALVLTVVAVVVELVLVARGLSSQRDEMRTAAATEIVGFVDANTSAFGLFDLRTDEADAVAAQAPGGALYARFQTDADTLADHLSTSGARSEGLQTLQPAVTAYVDSAGQVERLDARSGHPAAVAATLDGDSAIAYRTARGLAVSTVNRSTADLQARLDAAADAGVDWVVPVGMGAVAAGSAALGLLRRGRDYR